MVLYKHFCTRQEQGKLKGGWHAAMTELMRIDLQGFVPVACIYIRNKISYLEKRQAFNPIVSVAVMKDFAK